MNEEFEDLVSKEYPQLKATVSQYEDFEDSLIWQDMQTWLQDQLEYLKTQLINETDERRIRILQGGAQSIIFLLDAPTFLRDEAELQRDMEKQQQEQKGDQNG